VVIFLQSASHNHPDKLWSQIATLGDGGMRAITGWWGEGDSMGALE